MQIPAHPRQVVFTPINRGFERITNLPTRGAMRKIRKSRERRHAIGRFERDGVSRMKIQSSNPAIKSQGVSVILENKKITVRINERNRAGQPEGTTREEILRRHSPELRRIRDETASRRIGEQGIRIGGKRRKDASPK